MEVPKTFRTISRPIKYCTLWARIIDTYTHFSKPPQPLPTMMAVLCYACALNATTNSHSLLFNVAVLKPHGTQHLQVDSSYIGVINADIEWIHSVPVCLYAILHTYAMASADVWGIPWHWLLVPPLHIRVQQPILSALARNKLSITFNKRKRHR